MDCRSLPSVVLPGSITQIGDNAFANCIGLSSVVMPRLSSPVVVGSRAFANCKSLQTVQLPQGSQIAPDAFVGTPMHNLM